MSAEERPTAKQLHWIEDIAAATGMEFIGTTRKEASEYIDENLDLYRFMKDREMWLDRLAEERNC